MYCWREELPRPKDSRMLPPPPSEMQAENPLFLRKNPNGRTKWACSHNIRFHKGLRSRTKRIPDKVNPEGLTKSPGARLSERFGSRK